MSSSSGVTSPIKAAIQGSKGSPAQIVQIIKLPADLQNSSRSIRLEGLITSQNLKNDTVQIETEQGPVEVKIKGNRRPEIGQKVELDIPPGKEAQKETRQATIRTDAPSPQNTKNTRGDTPISPQTPATLAPKGTRTSPQTTPEAVSRDNSAVNLRQRTSQALPTTIQESAQLDKNLATSQPPRLITPDTVNRLIAVSPAQAQNIAKEFLLSLPVPVKSTLEQTALRPNIISPSTINQISPALTTVSPPALLTQSTASPLTQIIGNTLQPIVINNFSGDLGGAEIAKQQITYLSPIGLKAETPLTPSQLAPVSSIDNLLLEKAPTNTTNPIQPAARQSQTPQPLPLLFDANNPTTIHSPRVVQIDTNITNINSPDVKLSPVTNGPTPPSPIPAATQFTPPILGANTATSIAAQVTGFTPQGLPLITVQSLGRALPQSFLLQQPATNLQLGSQLQLNPKTSITAPRAISPTALQAIQNPLLQGFQFPALDALYNNLLRTAPNLAASISKNLPTPGNSAQIAATAMTFIAAVKTGNLENWLGDKKIDLIQQLSGKNSLKGLTQESARGAVTADNSNNGDWRAVPLPMFWDSEIHRIMLYTRREKDNTNDNNDEHGQTRFVFDLSLTRMGDVQIDGLIKEKRLDLIIRTQNPFSAAMQQTMRYAFSNALDQTALSGELNFQGSTKNWVHVLKEKKTIGVQV